MSTRKFIGKLIRWFLVIGVIAAIFFTIGAFFFNAIKNFSWTLWAVGTAVIMGCLVVITVLYWRSSKPAKSASDVGWFTLRLFGTTVLVFGAFLGFLALGGRFGLWVWNNPISLIIIPTIVGIMIAIGGFAHYSMPKDNKSQTVTNVHNPHNPQENPHRRIVNNLFDGDDEDDE